ncbi:MAG: SGNH/GDSL hydrolase family protein [Bacteroidales bacterium]|nr:SGNH/GDSL hydrolase family protein [Bacteroidales bacterium]
MKRVFILLAVFCSLQANAQVWHDAADMHVFGKAVEDTYGHYVRFPEDINAKARKDLKYLGQDAAGLYVQFSTDSPKVHVRWSSVKKLTMSHMASVGSRGVDLYVKQDKGWRFVGSALPALDYNETTRRILKDVDPGVKEYRLYLSLYDGISKLEIGTEEGASFEPSTVEKRDAPVVMYGTSILQGGCVCRPGMAATNILGRWLDREVVNFGFSGNAKLDPEMAELMARVENPAVFVMDNVPNDSPELIREKGMDFVKILRAAHPDVPIVFVGMAHYSHDSVSGKSYQDVEDRNAAQKELYKQLAAAGDKKVYFVSGEKLIGTDGEATVDYTHQTDLGALRYSKVLYPLLKRLCK